jgi:FAD/FMN-containing dehydrogenase
MSAARTRLTRENVAELSQRVAGRVALPGDDSYDEECATFNVLTRLRPALVVGAAQAQDVQAAVQFAAERELPIAILGSGHQIGRGSEGAVLINLLRMSEVHIDPEGSTARVGGGARWQDVVPRAAEHGLAPANGSSPTVGVVGYTLGGGQSPALGRTYGYAADHVISMEIVTADGTLRTVTESADPDLFWALRGGKSNFGVVTSMEFGLFPVSRFYGGSLFFSGEHAAELLDAWRTWAATLPDEASSSIAFLRLPPLPDLPEPLRGTFVVSVRFASLGETAAAEELLSPMRKVAPTVMDMAAERPYRSIAELHMDPQQPVPFVDRAMSLSEFPKEAAGALLEQIGPDSGTGLGLVEIRALGGALDDQPLIPNAVAGRGVPYILNAIGTGPSADAFHDQLDGLTRALGPWKHDELMANFIGAGQGISTEEVLSFYGAARYERLAQIKRTYDPRNLFRANHNITPAP